MKFKILVNPTAGGGKTGALLPKVKEWLPTEQHRFIFVICESREELRREAKSASEEDYNGVIVMGGDGTIHDALVGMNNSLLPLGVLPSGRGNDFIRNIGLPQQLEKCCRLLENPRHCEIDLPMVNGIPFGSIASVGFDAAVARNVTEGHCPFPGSICYILAVFKTLMSYKAQNLTVLLDGNRFEGRFMMVTVANGRYYGGGMKIAPDASMEDGYFDICMIKNISKLSLIHQFPSVYRGDHVKSPDIRILRAKSVRIMSELQSDIAADGELVSKLPASFEFREEKARILI